MIVPSVRLFVQPFFFLHKAFSPTPDIIDIEGLMTTKIARYIKAEMSEMGEGRGTREGTDDGVAGQSRLVIG